MLKPQNLKKRLIVNAFALAVFGSAAVAAQFLPSSSPQEVEGVMSPPSDELEGYYEIPVIVESEAPQKNSHQFCLSTQLGQNLSYADLICPVETFPQRLIIA